MFKFMYIEQEIPVRHLKNSLQMRGVGLGDFLILLADLQFLNEELLRYRYFSTPAAVLHSFLSTAVLNSVLD